jgi:hypothetical protein
VCLLQPGRRNHAVIPVCHRSAPAGQRTWLMSRSEAPRGVPNWLARVGAKRRLTPNRYRSMRRTAQHHALRISIISQRRDVFHPRCALLTS